MEEFVEMISKKFKTSKVIIGAEVLFNGCRIIQDQAGNITMDMQEYVKHVEYIDITQDRKAHREDDATNHEVRSYRRLAGEMIWIGCGVLPQGLVIGSMMQQRVPFLKVKDLIEANRMWKELKDLDPIIAFKNPGSEVETRSVLTYSDAAFNISAKQSYGQTGVITGLWMLRKDGTEIYHAIDWLSTKQKRISHSSYGAEIIACTDADDHGLYLKTAMKILLRD